jgi:hypothetical protein
MVVSSGMQEIRRPYRSALRLSAVTFVGVSFHFLRKNHVALLNQRGRHDYIHFRGSTVRDSTGKDVLRRMRVPCFFILNVAMSQRRLVDSLRA